MLKYWVFWRLAHIALDFVLVYTAFLLAYFVRVGWIFTTDFNFGAYALMAIVGTFVWVSFLAFARYYRIPPRSGGKEWFDLVLILVGGGVANGLLIVTYFFSDATVFSRLISVYAFVFGAAFLGFSQLGFRGCIMWLKKRQKQSYRLLIIGANRISEQFIDKIKHNPYALYKVVGVIDPYGLKKNIKDSQVLGKLDKLERVCEEYKVNSILDKILNQVFDVD